MYDTILIATDGSECAGRAAATGLSLAATFGATVHVVYVLDLSDVPDSVSEEAATRENDHGARAVGSIEREGRELGVSVQTNLLDPEDGVHEAIVSHASEIGASLIVQGSHGRTGVRRILLGSVAERTIRAASIPVLTVTTEMLMSPLERILIPTDGSAGALAAANQAIQLADRLDATLHVIHAVDVSKLAGDVAAGSLYVEYERQGERAVDEVVKRAKEAGVSSIERRVVAGRPARAIVDYAQDHDIELIAIGTHGRSGIDRYLVGSVAEKVVRMASMPVLTAKAGAEDA